MESSVLEDVIPQRLCLYIRNASVSIDSVSYVIHSEGNAHSLHHIASLASIQKEVNKEQILSLAGKWNNYNELNHILWTADTTGLALLPWRERKKLLNIEDDDTDTGGFEFYSGGIFEFPPHFALSFTERDSLWNAELKDSLYVSGFDWRNRHGKNWITPVKNQGLTNGCWAFSAIGTTESVVNLYYNQLLNIDLSEQELISCSRDDTNNYMVGGDECVALSWISNNGIIDEVSFPFQYPDNYIPCSDKPNVVNERVSFFKARRMYSRDSFPNTIKKNLMEKGPLAVAIKTGEHIGHAVVLVGYGRITEGEIVDTVSNYSLHSYEVESDYPHLGETYWILKDSYHDIFPDYMLIYMPFSFLTSISYIVPPITSLNYTDNDIMCVDDDGDGYYCWGIGPKPQSCPNWVPDEPDGDDSDDTLGPMDEYGHLFNLVDHIGDTIYVNTDTIWNNRKYLYRHIVVQNGATLTVSNEVTFYKTVELILRNGKIIIDGGNLINAVIKNEENSNSQIEIRNNGNIQIREENIFSIPLGNKLIMDYGKIH